jgi:hypothetical protein
MNDYPELLAYYKTSVDFPQVSGFEVLELLDVRSRLALAESNLSATEKEQLEKADEVFLMHAAEFYEQVAVVADIREMRHRAAVPVSHWWWHLEKFSRSEKAVATA